ncbi:tRNA (adenosine(37)-N6)-threonylcarbamoyltransferase complex ATPase subunit type 1 TsaE [Bifidobacterium sp.]|uniref:tRNA (adenosine(37)-N6)-threonylcarbamoyltransferase complex ATPase subunit type 1 TsaE n=1 Tax=Bifidobacterium sp. TaxID=41200 RepID=UPI0025BDFDC8|nr:tRNA (adenosine(37)-N6)-threonylcarbamoyltransferase complex ATPase subunit type 1 TsaE [Bifidobacterium sp.]MCH4208599.1 tRNA (adenosine(37)-N6)-threonylcarbamoyltransferase complex ATPase subunit type 1 TsaE [Bifidobacterium sp.]MCI1224285.1 tRNA (adenosine(37)-N6)-threonylcarbamoyltransferase complex ATPase subunit type 1 TsaE [Bifidobacterium sp.]
MRALGEYVAGLTRGGDVILLSGPLGAGKTTFAQGFGAGLGVTGPIVSPTFTIAREMNGHFGDGSAAHCVHVDAYRLGGERFAPGQNSVDALLDELESLGLDEELEDPSEHTVVLMEWGEQMVAAFAPERLEIHIARGSGSRAVADAMDAGHPHDGTEPPELSENGERIVTLIPVGKRWNGEQLDAVLSSAGCTLVGGNATGAGEEQL